MRTKNVSETLINTNNNNSNNHNNNSSNKNNNNNNNNNNQENITITQKLYHYLSLILNVISVEVVLILYTVPIFLLAVPAQNLAYEKTCRVNLAYPMDVCDLMMTKKSINLDCTEIRQNLLQPYNETIETILANEKDYERILTTLNITKLHINICNAERESQTYESDINTKTSFGEFALNVMTLLMVGELSDKKGYRKLSILVPLLGELFSYIVLLIASIFMNELQMEFSSVLAVLITAMGGGSYCFNSGMYSLLSDKTEPNQRSKRFIIYAIFLGFAIIGSSLLSAMLLEKLGYIKLICLCITINLFGILYLKFILKDYVEENINNNNNSNSNDDYERNVIIESNNNKNHSNSSYENPSFYGSTNINNNERLNADPMDPRRVNEIRNDVGETNKCFGNRIWLVIKHYRTIIERKRSDSGRLIINILFLLFLFVLIPVYGESTNEYSYARYQFGWNEYDQTLYFALSFIIYALGSIFMMHILKSLFKFSDQFLGLLATAFSTVSRILFIYATTGTMMYIARAFDAFMQVRAATIKSILSNIGDASELGKIFSICGMIEATARFCTQFGYGKIYVYIKDTTYFKVSTVFVVISLILFIILYIVMKRVATKKQMEIDVKSNPTEGSTSTSTTTSPNTNLQNEPSEYITHM